MKDETKQRRQPKLAQHLAPKREQAKSQREQVLAVADEIFDRYVAGASYERIVAELKLPVKGWKLREILLKEEQTAEQFSRAGIVRSHYLVESALEYAAEAARMGTESGLKVAIDAHLKVAAKLNAEYNDKASLELTGKDGGAIKIISMSDDDLLKIAASAKEAGN